MLGTTFLVTFTMGDGSTLDLTGSVQDTGAAKVGVMSLLGSGSKCGLVSTGPFQILKQ